MNEQITAVNELLRRGEPGNLSQPDQDGHRGYSPQAIVDAMNEVLWNKWGFEEISSELVAGEKGLVAVCQVSVRLAGVDWQPVGWGQGRVTRGDVGDARKGAQTDAIKKALSYFSVGNRAYLGLLGKQDMSVATAEQNKRLAAYGAKLGYQVPEGLTYDDADQLLREWYDEYQAKRPTSEKGRLNGSREVQRDEQGVPMH